MMFPDAENVEPNLVGEFHLRQQMLHTLDGAEGEAGGRVGDGRCEAVDADLHFCGPNESHQPLDGQSEFWIRSAEPMICRVAQI